MHHKPLSGTLFPMPVLKTLVENETKISFRSIAKGKGISESELLRAVVFSLVAQDIRTDQPITPDPENAETERITVRMPRFIREAAKERAKSKGMAPSRWIAALVQSHLTGQPVMTKPDLSELQASNRELAAIGRNINQIAKALNEAFYETERVRLDKLAELKTAIAENRAMIRALIRASQNAWEAEE